MGGFGGLVLGGFGGLLHFFPDLFEFHDVRFVVDIFGSFG